MKIHEYQAKEILRGYGVPVPRGRMTTQAAEVYDLAKEMGGTVVVKAQIHAGGRGKAGGVKLARTAQEAEQLANQILGMNLVTHQTGPQGKVVKRLLVEAGAAIEREFYLGMVLDRDTASVVIISSTEGGTEIEHVAATTPERIHKVFVDPVLGIQPHQARLVAFSLGLTGKPALKAALIVERLYRAFVEKDCSLAEVNPLILTKSGDVMALDAKINFDSNALYRHPELQALRDTDEEDPAEVEASKHDLNYIKLDGDIGCMVNGAGLAMATMDIIQAFGGQPANFLDVGGGTTKERVAAAFRVLLKDRPRAIFVNIFGGIVRCDVIASGIVAALQETELSAPLVVRLEGTNLAEGRQILADSGLPILSAKDMEDGAQKAGQAARG